MTAQQVGDRCGLSRTAARRYLLTLQHLGYVSSDAKQFWLTPRIMRLGQSYLASARLLNRAACAAVSFRQFAGSCLFGGFRCR
jgi:DNA-binding IclR family transcriptional regulator